MTSTHTGAVDDLQCASAADLARIDNAASCLMTILAAEHARGTHPVQRLLSRAPDFQYWEHLPKNDVRDMSSGACWFYHVHAPGGERADADEHGHFHCFIHRRHLARHGKLIAGPTRGTRSPQLGHYIALAMRRDGLPLSWFTVAQSVTGDYFYPASALNRARDTFKFTARGPLAPTTRWLHAMVGLYAPTISRLLLARDMALAAQAKTEILSSAPADFPAYLDALDTLLTEA